MRAKDNMITQGIKRWLKSLFAWWPWGQSAEADYAQASGTRMQSTTQETLFLPTADGPHAQPAQPGITSVAVEPLEGEPQTESGRPLSEERSSSPMTPSIKPIVDENNTPFPILEEKKNAIQEVHANTQELPAPTPQQRLEFLRYLVERGIVNEGHTRKP